MIRHYRVIINALPGLQLATGGVWLVSPTFDSHRDAALWLSAHYDWAACTYTLLTIPGPSASKETPT